MAKKHKESEKIKIQWDGDLSHPKAGQKNQSIPSNVELGTWAGLKKPNKARMGFDGNGFSLCLQDYDPTGIYNPDDWWSNCYFEDWDIVTGDGRDEININDIVQMTWHILNDTQSSFTSVHLVHLINLANAVQPIPPRYSDVVRVDYTWGDVTFVTTIADGIGTGSRRARETRLNQFEEEKKKKLIRLICRVKGEKVYDEEKEMGDTYIKLEDADLVINEVLGKMRVENANVL